MALIARPDATAMLEGMAAALVEAVGPELTTDYARSQLASAVTLLRYLAGEFDGAAQSRLEEIAEVEETLAGAAPALIAAGAGDLAGRLTALLAEPAADARLSTLARRLDALDEALLAVLLEAERAAAASTSLAAVRAACWAQLERSNARRLPR